MTVKVERALATGNTFERVHLDLSEWLTSAQPRRPNLRLVSVQQLNCLEPGDFEVGLERTVAFLVTWSSR